MKQLASVIVAVGVLVGAVALSQQVTSPPPAPNALEIQSGERNPWTHLRMVNEPDVFRFAIVSDRTGGHRPKIFSRAVEQLNYLQPEFVLSVGDLIEGYTTDRDRMNREWQEFQRFSSRLQMPFFYVAGNHDIANPAMEKLWEEKFGRRYYHFVYKDVLFLMLCSDDPPQSSSISAEQVEWVKKTLAENANANWTVVALHKPIWTGKVAENGWGEVEKALAGRNHTAFAGHVHRYQKFNRNGMAYYQLATTGGGSRLRGVRYGEFDHIVWVTMKKTGPVLANVMLDGIYPEDLTIPETDEPVIQLNRKPTHPVRGYVYVDGTPAVGATVTFHLKEPGSKGLRHTADALTESDGSFVLSTYSPGDGAPAGEYAVTVSQTGRYYDAEGPARRNVLPEKYARPATSELTAAVKAGQNEVNFDLKR